MGKMFFNILATFAEFGVGRSCRHPCIGMSSRWTAPPADLTAENQVVAYRWPAYAVCVKQRRKRHHYLPESYLKAWAGERGQVAVRRRDQPDAFCTTTRNVAVEADLYALPTDAGLAL